MSLLKPILDCLFGSFEVTQAPPAPTRSDESIASDMVTKILNAESPETLHKAFTDEISITSWTESIARATLHALAKAIETAPRMAAAASKAVTQAKDAAVDFTNEHPVYSTLIALGALAILAPWMLEVLGFGELGPVEGSFAAGWQRAYGGYVPKRALFGYFQMLGMKWNWFPATL